MALLAVTELKQWAYCPRIVYYHQVMPGVGRPTYKMKEAVAAQELVEGLEMRRGLRQYGLENARRRFGVWLQDEAAGLSGKVDLLLDGEGEAAVVDFKLTSGELGENHRLQMAGYAVLVEGALGLPVSHAFVYRIPDSRTFPVALTAELREAVVAAARRIRGMAEEQWFPEATAVRPRCAECEYANYCSDVW